MTYEIYHHGILGMKWGVRRWQNEDGSLTPAGRKRYRSQEAADMDLGLHYFRKSVVNQYKKKGFDTDLYNKYRDLIGGTVVRSKPELVQIRKERAQIIRDEDSLRHKIRVELDAELKKRNISIESDEAEKIHKKLRDKYAKEQESIDKRFRDNEVKQHDAISGTVDKILGVIGNEKISKFGRGSLSDDNYKGYMAKLITKAYLASNYSNYFKDE